MVRDLIGEIYSGLNEEKYREAIKVYEVKEEDAQINPEKPVEFYMSEIWIHGIPLLAYTLRIPYKTVEEGIKKLAEDRRNYSFLAEILKEIVKYDQKVEKERWKWTQGLDAREYDLHFTFLGDLQKSFHP